MPTNNYQKIPASGPEREKLREKGQFWTPSWVADAMVSYVLRDQTDHIFDPAVGPGVFFRSALLISKQQNRQVKLFGTEIDPDTFHQSEALGLVESDFQFVENRDFILNPPTRRFDAIVANPPYIRHHRLPIAYKTEFKKMAISILGKSIDGRAGVHIYFLLQALHLLRPNGRLCFIMPADTCEGLFAKDLWSWITKNYSLDAVLTFDKDASPFPKVDTNAMVFFIRNSAPSNEVTWAVCKKMGSAHLIEWVQSDFHRTDFEDLNILNRSVSESIATGLSRPPRQSHDTEFLLLNFATTSRGIASGANDFFLFTSKRAQEIGIPDEFLVNAVSKTRDVKNSILTKDNINSLDQSGIPTRLLSLDGRNFETYPETVRDYISFGEKLGLSKRALLSQRNPWYKMETREVPPILFAYLGRRNCRFILNEAKVYPLTGFLCVYPKHKLPEDIWKLFLILNDPNTIENLHLVGKSYGSGAIKVEPRALEKLPISGKIIEKYEFPMNYSHN